jgi:hypothetical protein
MSQGRTDRDACLIEVAAVTASSINHEETGRAEGEKAREEGATCPNRRHLGEPSLSSFHPAKSLLLCCVVLALVTLLVEVPSTPCGFSHWE